jgi:uncharacterized protein
MMLNKYDRPLPVITTTDKDFWAGTKRRELLVYKCLNCGRYYFPATHCLGCDNPKMSWVKASGKGTIYTYIVYRTAYEPSWKDHLPYNVAWVQLAEGPMMLTNIVGCKTEDISIGMEVEPEFEDITEEITLLKFKPVKS